MAEFALSNFLEDEILNHFFRNSAASAVAPEVALFLQPAGNVFTTTFAADQIDDTAHGLANDAVITLSNSGGALPAGLLAATRYYVINSNANDFQVSLTHGGAAETFTDDGTGTHSWHDFLAEDKTGQTEASGNGYAQQSVTFAAPTTSGDRRQVQNSAAVTFTASGGDLGGGEISTMAIFDATTNMLSAVPITPVTVADGNTLRFDVNQITQQMS